MFIPVNAFTIAAAIILTALLLVSMYLALGHILDYQKFREPNRLRAAVLFDVNLERRVDNLYRLICWHVEDATQNQPVTLGEYSVLASFIVANAIEGMNRQDTSATLTRINELARELKNQTRQPARKENNTVTLQVKESPAPAVH